MKIQRPEFFANVPDGCSFKMHDGAIVIKDKGGIVKDGATYWTKEIANREYLCYPIEWTDVMISSFGKYSHRIQRLVWQLQVIKNCPEWLR